MLKKWISCLLCTAILLGAGSFICTVNAEDAIDSNFEQMQDPQVKQDPETEKYQDSFLFKFTQFLNRISFRIFDIPVIGGIIQGTLQALVIITLGPLFFIGMIGANVAGHIYDQFRAWLTNPASRRDM